MYVKIFSEWMDAQGFNQLQAAAYLGYTQGQISRWLSKSAMVPEVVHKLVYLELLLLNEVFPCMADYSDVGRRDRVRDGVAGLQGTLQASREWMEKDRARCGAD